MRAAQTGKQIVATQDEEMTNPIDGYAKSVESFVARTVAGGSVRVLARAADIARRARAHARAADAARARACKSNRTAEQ